MDRARGACVLVICIGLAGWGGGLSAQTGLPLSTPTKLVPGRGVPYFPTPDEVVAEMLRMARVGGDDVIYDLGSGDGRIVISAARIGARGIGVELDPQLVKDSNENARRAGVADRVQFLQQDLFELDLSPATVVTLYLLPGLNEELRPKLLGLRPGTRIVSHDFDMGDWEPERVLRVQGWNRKHALYYWVIPANAAGTWRGRLGGSDSTLTFRQEFQKVSGTVLVNGQNFPLAGVRLVGDRLNFTLMQDSRPETAMQFAGHIDGDTIKGSVNIRGGPSAGAQDWLVRRDTQNTP
ncbi:MAG: methyltransferase domain-containing protein [Gemmatimonadaceae bacterium]|nr:methyltransferase domain-containing protein [Gloeobacterales cyanobacterium ES-bin-141]